MRLRRADLDQAVSWIERAGVAEGIGSGSASAHALDRLKRIAAEARPIPLTAEVRCDRETIANALDQLRGSIPEGLKEAQWRWKQAGGTDPPATDEIWLDLGDPAS